MKRVYFFSIVAVFCLGGLGFVNIKSNAHNNEQKNKIIEQIDVSNFSQINIINVPENPLIIQDAKSKEISKEDFIALVGEIPSSLTMSSYPSVVLLNNSSKIIRSFAVVVSSALERQDSGHVLIQSNLKLTPGSTNIINSADWVRLEQIAEQKDSHFVTKWRQPKLDSAKAWLPGSSSDLKILVAFVTFDDSTQWTMSLNPLESR